MGNKQFILLKENLTQSILSDIFTFGLMFGGFYLNHIFINDNKLLNWILLLMLFMSSIARTTGKQTRFNSKKRLIEYLNK